MNFKIILQIYVSESVLTLGWTVLELQLRKLKCPFLPSHKLKPVSVGNTHISEEYGTENGKISRLGNKKVLLLTYVKIRMIIKAVM